MNKKNTAVVFFIFFTVIVALISHLAVLRSARAERNISCTTSLINYMPNSKLEENVTFSIVPKTNSGIAYLTGVYTENGKKVGFLRRYIYFNYKKVGNTVYLTSVRIQKYQRDDTLNDELLEKITSDFLIKKDKTIKFNLYRQNESNYVFFTGKIPRALCLIHP